MKTMRTLLLSLSFLLASLAAHALTVVPLGENQSAPIGTFFPERVGVRVTDDAGPVVGAPVTFSVAPIGAAFFYDAGGVRGDSMMLLTDADGYAVPGLGLFAWQVGAAVIVDVEVEHADGHFHGVLGGLTVLPGGPTSVDEVSGSNQLAVVGTPFCKPLTAVALDANRRPVPHALVIFMHSADSDAEVTFGAGEFAVVRADARGMATSPIPVAGPTRGHSRAMALAQNVGAVRYALYRFVNLPAQAGYRCR